VTDLSREELAGGWARLCAAMLAQAAFAVAERGYEGTPAKSSGAITYRQEMALQRKVALQWLAGGEAVIPLSEICEQLDYRPEYVQAGIVRYAARSVVRRDRRCSPAVS
jgi:hypothetical protein